MSSNTNIVKSYYQYSISIEKFDEIVYEGLEIYDISYKKNSVSNYRKKNVIITYDSIIFTNTLDIENIKDILDQLKIILDTFNNEDRNVFFYIYKKIKMNCCLEQITNNI